MAQLLSNFLSVKDNYFKVAKVGVALGVLLLLAIRIQTHVKIEFLTRDPAAILNSPFYYGALSSLGIQLWTASAVVCLLGAVLLKILQGRNTEPRNFLAAFGGFSLILGIDDLFMLHELVFPRVLGIPEKAILLTYLATFSILLFRFRKLILKVQPYIFSLSLLLFAFSVGFDVFSLERLSANDQYWIEDGSKFLALLSWFFYFFWASIHFVFLAVQALLSDRIFK